MDDRNHDGAPLAMPWPEDGGASGPPAVAPRIPIGRRRLAASLLVAAAVAWPLAVWVATGTRPSGSGLDVYVMFGVFDLLVALVLIGPRPGPAWLGGGYAGVRLLIAAGSFVLPSAICYALAALLLLRRVAAPVDGRADGPHPYQPLSDRWYTGLTPVWWSRTPFGAAQRGMAQCAICGGAEDDLRHVAAA